MIPPVVTLSWDPTRYPVAAQNRPYATLAHDQAGPSHRTRPPVARPMAMTPGPGERPQGG